MTKNEKRDLQKVSRLLAKVLRHTPETLGLTLDKEGWVAVDVLLAALAAQDLPTTLDQLIEIVRTNDKQRFTLSQAGDQIRAAQGHSIAVDLGLTKVEPPAQLYHGTSEDNLPAILVEGLRPLSRQHVHLSTDRQTALKVGSRHGAPVVLIVNAGEMHFAGHAFYQADNGVWLTDQVPAECLKTEKTVESSAD